jgi:hypothetical protein
MRTAASDQARLPLSLSRASRRRKEGPAADEMRAIAGVCGVRV